MLMRDVLKLAPRDDEHCCDLWWDEVEDLVASLGLVVRVKDPVRLRIFVVRKSDKKGDELSVIYHMGLPCAVLTREGYGSRRFHWISREDALDVRDYLLDIGEADSPQILLIGDKFVDEKLLNAGMCSEQDWY